MVVKAILNSLMPVARDDGQGAQTTKRINLALQGGGAHGAFTWGVLDKSWPTGGWRSTAFRALRPARSTP